MIKVLVLITNYSKKILILLLRMEFQSVIVIIISKKKTIQNIINETFNISFLIVEGIFAKEFLNTLNNKDYIFLEIKTKKNECMKRVVQRDIKERGKDEKQAENDFLKSWDIYYKKFKPHSIKNNTNKFIIEKNTDIDHILKKLFN